MDQTPQEILHSLFSLDPGMESRGHLYPYNYPYGQYPYPYPYPYGAPHPPPPSSIPPPPSPHSIPSSVHSISQSSQNLSVPQGNLPTFPVGIHGIRPSVGDARLQANSVNEQVPEDLRSLPAESRNLSDSRFSINMRPTSMDQRYVDELRSVNDHTRSSMHSRHVVDCPQPTDLTTQGVDARLYGNARQSLGDVKGSSNCKPTVNPCSDSLSENNQRSTSDIGHPPPIAKDTLNHMTGDFRYSGEMQSYANRALGMAESGVVMQQHMPSGDPRPPISVQDQGMSLQMHQEKSSLTSQGGAVVEPMKHTYDSIPVQNHPSADLSADLNKTIDNQHYYDETNSTRKEAISGSQNVDYKSMLKDSAGYMARGNYTQSSPVPSGDSASKANMRYPTINSPNTSLGLISHALGEHLKERTEPHDSALGDATHKPDTSIGEGDQSNPVTDETLNGEPLVYNTNQDRIDGDELDELEEEEDEDDFDSEASSLAAAEDQSPYIEYNDVAYGVLKNINSIAGPAKPFHCEECDATFTTKGNLKVHKRIHTGERPYECEDCGKTFSYCASFQSHKLIHTGHRPYQCDYCERAFFRSEHLERHRRRHTGERPYKCTECDATFAASDGLARHTRTHTGERPYKCKECGMSFAYKSTSLRHKLAHTVGEFICDDCGAVFKDPIKFEKHTKKHNDPNYTPGEGKSNPRKTFEDGVWIYGCEFCQMKFRRKSDYNLHRRTHTGEKPFACDICGAAFIRRTYLEIHMRTHTGERPYKCTECESAFKTRTALKFHIRIHTGERPYKCEVCEFAFAQKSAMKAHMRIHTGDRPFKCDECDAAFRHSSSLTIHKRTHTGEKPYICNICGAAFSQKPHLNLHKRSHTGIKPHKCDECDASFTKKDYLLAHKSKHAAGSAIKIEQLVEAAGEHAFKCPDCDMVFTHHSSLTVHMRKHTGERPFVCNECGASFLYSSNLTTHRRKHTGERPYKCDQCDSSFILKSYLTMHLRKHSGERPFKCDDCGACFTQKTHLSTHRRIHTGECPYKCEECGDAFRDGANFWRHKKKHLNQPGGVKPARKKSKRGRGRGGGRGRRVTVSAPRRTSRVRRSRMNYSEMYEQFIVTPDGETICLKEEPEDIAKMEEDDDELYIPINPMVEIKLEDSDEEEEEEAHEEMNIKKEGSEADESQDPFDENMEADGLQDPLDENMEKDPLMLKDDEEASIQKSPASESEMAEKEDATHSKSD